MPCGSWGMTNWEQQCYYHTVAPLKSSVAPRCVVVVVFQPVTHVSAMTLCDPMDCNTPGFPVLHCLLEFAQIHVRWVSSAIQPSHPLSPASPPALSLSQLFQWGSFPMSWLFTSGVQSIGAPGSASVLPMNIGASLMTQMVNNLPIMQGTWVQSLVWEDPLEKGIATHSIILAWRITWTEKHGRLHSMGTQRVRHDWETFTMCKEQFSGGLVD